MTDNDLCPADSAEPVYHLSNVEKNILWKTLMKSVVNIKPELADSGNTWQVEIITLRAQVADMGKDAARYQAIVSMTSGRLRDLKLIQKGFGDQAFHEAIDEVMSGSETK